MITIAIAVHNIPEGVGDFGGVEAARDERGGVCGVEYFFVVAAAVDGGPCFLFVEWAKPLLPMGLEFAAGAMVLVVFMELLLGVTEKGRRSDIALIVCVSIGLMILFSIICDKWWGLGRGGEWLMIFLNLVLGCICGVYCG